MKGKGSNWHPARISGIQKQLREREANLKVVKSRPLKPLDLSKGDWSLKK